MSSFDNSIYNLKTLDDIGDSASIIHRINPISKLIVTLLYVIFVVSFGKYEIAGLIPFLLYAIAMIYITDIPIKLIFKVSLVGLPFIVGLGVFNIIIDRNILFYVGIVPITRGVVSFTSLLLKGILTISSGVILICTTKIEDIAKALSYLKVPKIFTTQIVFMYRYIFVLIESAKDIYNAYMLRAPNQKGVHFKVWGPLLGQLLLRSFDRADRIYNAMILRGFKGEYVTYTNSKLVSKDYIYMLFWICFFVLTRLVNIPLFIGNLVMGGM